jgi:hypothetical protein
MNLISKFPLVKILRIKCFVAEKTGMIAEKTGKTAEIFFLKKPSGRPEKKKITKN